MVYRVLGHSGLALELLHFTDLSLLLRWCAHCHQCQTTARYHQGMASGLVWLTKP